MMGVPAELIPEAWDVMRKPLARSIRHARGTLTMPDLWRRLRRRDAQLWVTDNGSVVVTQIEVHRGFKSLRLLTGAGVLADHDAIAHTLEQYAAAHGCCRMDAAGRRGWARVARGLGWRVAAVEITREVRQ